MTQEKKDQLFYWLCTLLFIVPMLFSALAYLMKVPAIIEGFTHLGYPLYLVKVLGVAKLMGVFAIIYGKFAFLKEWAYSGFTFNFLGASASHLFSGDPLIETGMPLIFLALLLGSYYFWKKKVPVWNVVQR